MIIISYSSIWILTKIPSKSFETKKYLESLKISFNQNLIDENKINQKDVLENSILGKISKKADVIFKPIGFDWKVTLSVLSSVVAKEIAIGTLFGLYQDN